MASLAIRSDVVRGRERIARVCRYRLGGLGFGFGPGFGLDFELPRVLVVPLLLLLLPLPLPSDDAAPRSVAPDLPAGAEAPKAALLLR